eukprot:364467-Chlamydomonas_euryale.AAC.1
MRQGGGLSRAEAEAGRRMEQHADGTGRWAEGEGVLAHFPPVSFLEVCMHTCAHVPTMHPSSMHPSACPAMH